MSRNYSSTRRALTTSLLMVTLLVLIATVLWAQGGSGKKSIGFVDVLLLPRVWVSVIFCLVGLALLMKSWVCRNLRLLFLVAMFFVFAVVSALPLGKFAVGMGMHPSPICTVTRPFQFLDAGRAVPVVFLAILASIAVLSVIGNKLFCGWVCPIGAVQEISHRIRLPEKLKVTLPFRITNTIRTVIFVAFVVVVFSAGKSVYDYFNPFEFLHWGFEAMAIAAFAATLIAAVFIFRPFCYLICPLGLITWVLEHASLVKVKLDNDLCTRCDICVHLSHCPAVPSILEGKKSRPDCYACGRCLEVCPEGALAFRK